MIYGELNIVFQDPHLVVVEKPGGLLSVPGRGPQKQDSVATRLRKRFPTMIDQPAVHRLDMYTSGLMVLAISPACHRELSKQFERRQVHKVYQALLDGAVTGQSGRIELRFRLDPENRPYQVYDPERGKPGITNWRVLERLPSQTRVEFVPLTGRTHQLRLHAAHPMGLACPVAGDSLYGLGNDGDPMCLHASLLRFRHPQTGELLEFSSQPPF